MMKLTLRKLANLSLYAWEVHQKVGFHNGSPREFKDFVAKASTQEINNLLESLGLLIRTVEEIGESQVELKAEGHEALFAPLVNTGASVKANTKETVLPPIVMEAIDEIVRERLSGENKPARW